MKRPLCYYGNPILRVKALPIETITDEIRQLAADMIETMDALNGVGLAANQVGVALQIFVIRPELKNEQGDYVLGPPEVYLNPRLSHPTADEETMNEGCLSFPGLHAEVTRPYGIHLEALDLEGKKVALDLFGFKAREIMHENDHLNGKLFIDRVTEKTKKEIAPFLKELKRKYFL
ncbi:MAG: peptide deformylase [Parachlamydiales bacterium]|jgi:peptide deformylase